MSKQLENQIALVTGATRGIGKAIAAQLQAQGAIVIGTATSDEGAAQIQADLEPLGGRGVCLDVTDDEATDALLAELAKEGGPHILVNNAGITRDGLALRLSDDDFDAVLSTNLRAVFRLSRGVIRPMMKARGGRKIGRASCRERVEGGEVCR